LWLPLSSDRFLGGLLNAEGEEKQMGTTVLFPPKLEAPNRMGDKLETKFINGEFMMLCVLNNE